MEAGLSGLGGGLKSGLTEVGAGLKEAGEGLKEAGASLKEVGGGVKGLAVAGGLAGIGEFCLARILTIKAELCI